jgi:predicted nuclease with TOPRIM domain
VIREALSRDFWKLREKMNEQHETNGKLEETLKEMRTELEAKGRELADMEVSHGSTHR